MSSTISARSDNSTKWWSLKSPNSAKDQTFREKQQSAKQSTSGMSLNHLASAMGFKAKKHPSLAIQEPPALFPARPAISAPLSPAYDAPAARAIASPPATRPPSKSASSTRSRVDSFGPKTPVDGQRDSASHRQSLLTLSDIDPFAVRAIASPLDGSRLSAYSNSSVAEYSTKGEPPINRGSYASSSSRSNYHENSPLNSGTFIPEPPPLLLKCVIFTILFSSSD